MNRNQRYWDPSTVFLEILFLLRINAGNHLQCELNKFLEYLPWETFLHPRFLLTCLFRTQHTSAPADLSPDLFFFLFDARNGCITQICSKFVPISDANTQSGVLWKFTIHHNTIFPHLTNFSQLGFLVLLLGFARLSGFFVEY